MALKATIYKADLQVADMNRQYYADHVLTLARHPSETEERLLVRLIAFACHADPALQFGKGLSDADEPDLWRKDLTGAIDDWIEVGQPDPRRLLKASGRATRVDVFTYGRTAEIWWKQAAPHVARAANLSVCQLSLPPEFEALARRSLAWQVTIQDSAIWISDGSANVEVGLAVWKARG